MCGRYVSSTSPDQLASYFGATYFGEPDPTEALIEPKYNVAPTDDVFVVVENSDRDRRIDRFRWGLVPFWAKDLKIGSRLINARADTVAAKSAFRSSLGQRRCIVPADGFYEWTVTEGQDTKTPVYIHGVDGAPLAFAGLWSTWRDPDDPEAPTILSCTIITGEPNERIAEVHNRMPVILPRESWDLWLDRGHGDVEQILDLLVVAPSDSLTFHTVSRAVNNVRSSGAELIAEVDPATGSPG